MRILIISDSHGRTDNIEQLKSSEGRFDMVIHCGDGAGDADYIAAILGCPVRCVTGNCDFFAGGRAVLDFEIEGKKVHVEHGQRLPYRNEGEMLDFARVNGYNLLLFGHTHCQVIKNDGNYCVVNPGSISKPRDGMPSYVVMKTDGRGNFTFEGKRQW